MDVFLTVDTECMEERLTRRGVQPPLGYDLCMWGLFANQREALGLGFILRELAERGFAATFFLETLCSRHFGVDGLAHVCRELRGARQDVQLHLHPNFLRPEWRNSDNTTPVSDNLGDYDLRTQTRLIRSGIETLTACGVPDGNVRAFRAGNYGADQKTLIALKDLGLTVDSSLNFCYLGRSCLMSPSAVTVDLHRAGGLWELPISCFRNASRLRHLEITAVSSNEMSFVLGEMQRRGFACATIVAHPGEFFVVDDWRRRQGRPNLINRARFRRLLDFLAAERDRFSVRTVGELALELGDRKGHTAPVLGIPRGSRVLELLRQPLQAVKRIATLPRGRSFPAGVPDSADSRGVERQADDDDFR